MTDVNPSPMVRIESTEHPGGSRVARNILVRLADGNFRTFRIREDGSAWVETRDRRMHVGWLPWPGKSGHDETDEVRKLDDAVRGVHRD